MMQALTEMASEIQAVTPYTTIQRPKPATFSSSIEHQGNGSIIHALPRSDVKDDCPSYNGFPAGLNMEQGKSNACFYTYTIHTFYV